ncbi:hypothetical protein QQA43_08200 [Mycolicibacterium vanbaalenii]|uniref:hypothetical protein n=1 Tax=Mycolicibacterium vanbaalenii TaxID=110539 RepID=UPI001F2F17B2|nr:hypothetical protein [Mycolicibacterium vanbaalenii]WND59998.1 hypothetical protein QQA43_08200 [Mycolicibacterium vanbaalenii]
MQYQQREPAEVFESSRPSAASERSMACLRANCHPSGLARCSTSSGSPPRCSTLAPLPTTSIRRGTTRTRRPSSSARWAVGASRSSGGGRRCDDALGGLGVPYRVVEVVGGAQVGPAGQVFVRWWGVVEDADRVQAVFG